MLKEEFLADYGLSQNQLAKAISISPNRIAEIVNNRRASRPILHFGSDSILGKPRVLDEPATHYDLKMARRTEVGGCKAN